MIEIVRAAWVCFKENFLVFGWLTLLFPMAVLPVLPPMLWGVLSLVVQILLLYALHRAFLFDAPRYRMTGFRGARADHLGQFVIAAFAMLIIPAALGNLASSGHWPWGDGPANTTAQMRWLTGFALGLWASPVLVGPLLPAILLRDRFSFRSWLHLLPRLGLRMILIMVPLPLVALALVMVASPWISRLPSTTQAAAGMGVGFAIAFVFALQTTLVAATLCKTSAASQPAAA